MVSSRHKVWHLLLSCPALCRASTSLCSKRDVDGRDKSRPRRKTCALMHEVQLLVGAVHDRDRIELEPLVENGRVDAAEVHVGVEIALHELARLERRHLAVMPALHPLAEHEGGARRAVIGSRAVVANAPA